MKWSKAKIYFFRNLALVVVFLYPPINIFAQSPELNFTINSKEADREYNIQIVLPSNYDPGISYPVLYCLDWLAYSGLMNNIKGLLEFSNLLTPLILVGITGSGGWEAFFTNRQRDFIPPENDSSVGRIKQGLGAGEADKFLNFLKNELTKEIKSRVNTDHKKMGIAGHSYGGLFATYAYLNEPGFFKYYVIGSPSLWVHDFSLLKELRENNKRKWEKGEAIFLTVGENEVGDQLTSFGYLRDYFALRIPSANFRSEIITDEPHSTAIVNTYMKGLRFLYGYKKE